FTYRYFNNFLWNPPNGVTPASYKQTGTKNLTSTSELAAAALTGTTSVPLYGATSAQLGYTAQNRPDYHQRYLGLELSATKRMANRWMGRVGFASTAWNEYFDAADAIFDPTRTLQASGQFGTTNVALDLDVFNLFNAATVLQYQANARVSTFNNILEVTQPRIIRLGARFFF